MYNRSLKYKWDNKNVMDYAAAQAELRGETKGKQEGKHEKAVEMAIEMITEGHTVAQITKLTKLTAEEIDALKKQLPSP